ncbi:MAG: putative porin [Sedimentisphaerales bacterium]|nr:putative porin [Sedimentisphaerales bacterium]
MKNKTMWILALAVLFMGAGAAKADEIGDLKKEVEKQYDVLLKMQTQIMELEAAQKKTADAVAKGAAAPDSPLMEKIKWVEKLRISGDFRYRFENQDFDTRGDERDRHRIRARIKLEADITDEWTVGIRVASGSSDSPVSTNQTLGGDGGDGFSSKDIWLDLAYGDWHPTEDFNILFGKMENPFYAAGKHQLIWDGDVTPEGGAMNYAFKLSDSMSASVTGGGFWVEENSDTAANGADAALWGIQGTLQNVMADGSHLRGGVSYYNFTHLEGNAFANLNQKGNTWTAANTYWHDYNLLEAFGEYGFKMGDMPTTAYGTYIRNTAGSVHEDTAWALGCILNKAKDPGTWQFGYEYRDIEADAVIGGLNDSDFVDGGTGAKGHRFSFTYQMAKNVQAAFTYFCAERHDNAIAGYDGQTMNTFQGDIVIKF